MRLKVTRRGNKLTERLVMQGNRKLRGEARITNRVGGIGTDVIPLTVRLKDGPR